MSFLLQITTTNATVHAATDTVTQAVAKAVDSVAATPATEQTMTLWELIMKGGPIMIPIAILFILTVYVVIERIIIIAKSGKDQSNFMNNIRDAVVGGNIEAAKALCKSTEGPLPRMIEKGISRIGKPLKEIEGAMENVGKLELYKLEKNLGILGLVAGIAPMFGFVGTIAGVIKIFYNISLADNISIGLIAGGLYEKMITSAAGLATGIIAYICYHWLSMLIDKITNRMEMHSVAFIDILQEPTK